MDVRKVHGETRIPLARSLGRGAREVAFILDGSAETGRAHHGAIATGQATVGHFIPTRVVQVAFEQFLNAVGLQAATHLTCGARHNGVAGSDVSLRSFAMRDQAEDIGTSLAAYFRQKVVSRSVYQLGQR